MPAVSKKQQRFFGYLLSNPDERKKRGISKKAAKDFAQDVKEEKKSCPEGQYYCFDMGKCRPIPKGKKVRADGELVSEVAPPGWGHTKAEKEKTKPWKPKSKIGGSAAAFKKDLESGKFKGLPGSKTKKEKTADMFKIMWAAKKKGYKPHYKPGTDKKYKKYQKESTMPNVDPKDRKVIKDRAKTLFTKDLKGTVRGVNESFGFEIDSGKHKTAQKKSKMRNLARGNENPNEKAVAQKKAGGPTLVGEGKTWKDFKRTIDTVRGKKQEMPKPKRADDAGAKARRALKRKEYQAKVSVIVPPELEEGAAWTKKSGKNPSGGLNEKGRKSYERDNPGSDLKAPSKKVGNKRRSSFCARMKGMKKKLTSAKTARDPDSRINKSLRAWNC